MCVSEREIERERECVCVSEIFASLFVFSFFCPSSFELQSVIGSNQKQRARRSLTGLFGCCCCGCFKGSSNSSWGVSCWWFGFDQRCGIGSFVQLVLGGGCGGEEGRWVGGEGEIGEMVWYRHGKQQKQQQ